MKFNIILAIDKENGIGKNNNLPWKFSEDLKYFMKMTTHSEIPFGCNAVIMGRTTCDSLPEKYLPNRLNIVLTRQKDYSNDNVKIG